MPTWVPLDSGAGATLPPPPTPVPAVATGPAGPHPAQVMLAAAGRLIAWLLDEYGVSAGALVAQIVLLAVILALLLQCSRRMSGTR